MSGKVETVVETKFRRQFECWEKAIRNSCFRRITRSFSKAYHNIRIVEVYRCMPLLGDEENIPNWQISVLEEFKDFW